MYITNRYGESLKYKSYDSGRENGGKKLMVYKIKLVNSGTKRCQAGILQHQMLLKINLIIKTMFLSQLNRPLNRLKLIFIVNVITDCDHCKYYLLQYFVCLFVICGRCCCTSFLSIKLPCFCFGSLY